MSPMRRLVLQSARPAAFRGLRTRGRSITPGLASADGHPHACTRCSCGSAVPQLCLCTATGDPLPPLVTDQDGRGKPQSTSQAARYPPQGMWRSLVGHQQLLPPAPLLGELLRAQKHTTSTPAIASCNGPRKCMRPLLAHKQVSVSSAGENHRHSMLTACAADKVCPL